MCKIICVTDIASCRGDFLTQLGRICEGRPDAVILRAKTLGADAYLELYLSAKEVCGDVLLVPHFYGIEGAEVRHMPLPLLSEERPSGRFGVSVHSVSDAEQAFGMGAEYIVAGHIFETDCKKGLKGRGTGFLHEVCSAVPIPVYAIGGITPENIGEVTEAGAAGVCVMSGLLKSEDPAASIEALRQGCRKK